MDEPFPGGYIPTAKLMSHDWVNTQVIPHQSFAKYHMSQEKKLLTFHEILVVS